MAVPPGVATLATPGGVNPRKFQPFHELCRWHRPCSLLPLSRIKRGVTPMRPALCGLTVLALALAPAVSTAQSTADAPKPATGSVMKDSWITTKAKSSLVFDKRVAASRVKVETYAGVITLRGKVSSVEERNAAEEVARDISGVTAVTNALQVVPDDQRKVVEAKDDGIEKAVKGRLEKDASLKDAGISVRSDNSVVTLMGTAPDRKSKAHASDVVRSVPGVRAIRNELAQKD